MRITSSTRVFALLGDPVGHSLSPVMQNIAFRAAGLDAIYVALRCDSRDVPSIIRSLTLAGGGGNVTVPHKTIAAESGEADDRVRSIGAANVFGSREGQPVVGNTDVDGLHALLDRLSAPATTWRIVGTGGSARAAVAAAAERGARVSVGSRSVERAEAFEDWATSLGVGSADAGECEVLINATPVGLSEDDPSPAALSELPAVKVVADLTYRAEGISRLIRLAREAGLEAADGREMLLAQGAAAWSYWFPGQGVPLEVMRAALAGKVD